MLYTCVCSSKVGFHTCSIWRRTLRSRRTRLAARRVRSRSVSWSSTSNDVPGIASNAASVTTRAPENGIPSTSPSTAATAGGRAQPSPTDDSSTGSPSPSTSNRFAVYCRPFYTLVVVPQLLALVRLVLDLEG